MEAHQERQPGGPSKALLRGWRDNAAPCGLVYLAVWWILQSAPSFLLLEWPARVYRTARWKLACVPWLRGRRAIVSSLHKHLPGVQTYVFAWSKPEVSKVFHFPSDLYPRSARWHTERMGKLAVWMLMSGVGVFIFSGSWRQFWFLQPNWLPEGKLLKLRALTDHFPNF